MTLALASLTVGQQASAAVLRDQTYELMGIDGERANVRAVISDGVVGAPAGVWLWTYTLTNISLGPNETQPYIDSDALTQFRVESTVAALPVDIVTTPAGWESQVFVTAAGTTGILWTLYAGTNPTSPSLPPGSSAQFGFLTGGPLSIGNGPGVFGVDAFGETTGLIAVPVPEPQTWLMLGAGVAFLGQLARAHRRPNRRGLV